MGLLVRQVKHITHAVQATREKFAEYITVLKEALRDGAEASAAHTAGISLLQPETGPAEAPHPPTPGALPQMTLVPSSAFTRSPMGLCCQ